MSMDEHKIDDLRAAWAALAARQGGPPDARVDLDLIVGMVDGKLSAHDQDRALAHLANTPQAWAVWRQLRELQAGTSLMSAGASSSKATVGDEKGWLARLIRVLMGDGRSQFRQRGLAFAALMVVTVAVAWMIRGVEPETGQENWAVSQQAIDWIAQASDLGALAQVSLDLPTISAGSAGLRDGGDANRVAIGAVFGAGFLAGRHRVQGAVSGKTIEAAKPLHSSTCASLDCSDIYATASRFGVWATLTSLRCEADLELPVAPGLEEFRHAIEHLDSNDAVPFALPRPDAGDSRASRCDYAQRLHSRFRAAAAADSRPES